MGPVAITLFATLLPACSLITILAGISLYLFIQLRALRVPTQEAENGVNQPPSTPQPEEDQLSRWMREPTYRICYLSDPLDPDLRGDVIHICCSSYGFNTLERCLRTWKYHAPRDAESWAQEILDDVGYKGGLPVRNIISLLQQEQSYYFIIIHTVVHVVLDHLSLDGDPEESLLPFTPEVHRWLRGFYKSLEGVKLSPEFTDVLSKFPFQLAEAYATQFASDGEGINRPTKLYNKKNADRLGNRLAELFGPIMPPEWVAPRQNVRGEIVRMGHPSISRSALNDAVVCHLRLLASHQRFELRWGHETTENGSIIDMQPALYSHVEPDGTSLSKPKLWERAWTEDLAIKGARLDGEPPAVEHWEQPSIDMLEASRRVEEVQNEEREGEHGSGRAEPSGNEERERGGEERMVDEMERKEDYNQMNAAKADA